MFQRYPFLPAIVWTAIIFVLSAMPGRFFPTISLWELLSTDKIVHAIMYGVLTWLLWRGCLGSLPWKISRTTTILGAAIVSTAYGASLEWMQENFFVGRLYEVLDMVANGIGATVAAVVGLVFSGKTRRSGEGLREVGGRLP